LHLFGRKQLQLEFLDHGVLTLLKNWLEPLPDGSLPNINIRMEILRILNEVIRVYTTIYSILAYYLLFLPRKKDLESRLFVWLCSFL